MRERERENSLKRVYKKNGIENFTTYYKKKKKKSSLYLCYSFTTNTVLPLPPKFTIVLSKTSL